MTKKTSQLRAEAVVAGKKTYTGKPCRNHPENRERLASNGVCVICSKEHAKRRHSGKPADNSVGHPSVLTDELTMQLCQAIAAGNYLETACQFAGVRVQTVRDWIFRGVRDENQSSAIAKFASAIKKAEAQAEIQGVMRIRKASEESWQAMAWWLERARKPRWSQHVQIDVKNISDEELAELILTGVTSGSETAGNGITADSGEPA
jgi:hypothetical protein